MRISDWSSDVCSSDLSRSCVSVATMSRNSPVERAATASRTPAPPRWSRQQTHAPRSRRRRSQTHAVHASRRTPELEGHLMSTRKPKPRTTRQRRRGQTVPEARLNDEALQFVVMQMARTAELRGRNEGDTSFRSWVSLYIT